MRKYIALLLSALSLNLSAQSISELFISMPEEITPLLTLNDKKEMIECWNQKLDTSVKNKLGCTSKIDTLTEDYIKVQLSEARSVTLFHSDGRIGVISTLFSPKGESTLVWYSPEWEKVGAEGPVTDSEKELEFVEYEYDPVEKKVKTQKHFPYKGEIVS